MPVIHVLKTHWQCKFRPALTAAAVSDGWCWRAVTAAAPLRPARVSQLSYCPALSFAWVTDSVGAGAAISVKLALPALVLHFTVKLFGIKETSSGFFVVSEK